MKYIKMLFMAIILLMVVSAGSDVNRFNPALDNSGGEDVIDETL